MKVYFAYTVVGSEGVFYLSWTVEVYFAYTVEGSEGVFYLSWTVKVYFAYTIVLSWGGGGGYTYFIVDSEVVFCL